MTTPPEKLAPTVRDLILRRLKAGTLKLAAMPEEASKVVTALNASVSLQEVAALVERSPSISAEVMRTANKAASGGRTVNSIPMAVTRLGGPTMLSIAIEMAVQKLFTDADDRVAKGCQAIWNHSLAVALISRDLCKRLKAGDAEDAYLAGILHDIGKPVVGQFLASVNATSLDLPDGWWDWWITIVDSIHRDVGIAMAQNWNIPEAVVSVIENVEDYDPADALSAANIVRFANALAKKNGFAVGDFNEDEVEALLMVGQSIMSISDDMMAELVEDLAARVAQPT